MRSAPLALWPAPNYGAAEDRLDQSPVQLVRAAFADLRIYVTAVPEEDDNVVQEDQPMLVLGRLRTVHHQAAVPLASRPGTRKTNEHCPPQDRYPPRSPGLITPGLTRRDDQRNWTWQRIYHKGRAASTWKFQCRRRKEYLRSKALWRRNPMQAVSYQA